MSLHIKEKDMVLRVCKELDSSMKDYCVPYSWLNSKSLHLFLACNKWEKLVVDLSEEIPANTLKYIVTRCDAVEVNLPNVLLDKHVELLCELYPDKAGSIRKAHIFGKDMRSIIG